MKPSICISDFISTGTETGNRSSFFTFILTCKYLGARKKVNGQIHNYILVPFYGWVEGPSCENQEKMALNYKVV